MKGLGYSLNADIKVVSAAVILITAASLILVFHLINKAQISKTSTVCFNGDCVEVEIARTSEQMQRGLMYRKSLGQDKGMLFIHQKEEIQQFWMKNTLIPLDIIWIDDKLTVVHIVSAEPCQSDPCQIYSSIFPAKYTLEVNKGYTLRHNIKPGYKVKIYYK